MIDLKYIRHNPELIKESLKKRHSKINIDTLLNLDTEKRKLLQETEQLKKQRNEESKIIGELIKQGKEVDSKKSDVKSISQKIAKLDKKVEELSSDIDKILYSIPNIPHSSVPVGKDDKANKIVKEQGAITKLPFKPKNHIELAKSLDIIDFERAAKIAASNFALFKGAGARLVRALINYMLDVHSEKSGYKEIWAPALVSQDSMFATGQLPKMEEDMYKLKNDDLYLIPTAEVPVTNMYRQEILKDDDLPVYLCAYTPCFRREAGSYGKDTRGLIRVHQFDKVELVKLVRPEESYVEHEKLLVNAEGILEALKIPYRVSVLSTGELSFAAAKCYDIEAWAPGTGAYLEVSSVSNFEDFQARRGNIRYKDSQDNKVKFVHTLNGSGVALARTVICILENYQQEDGSILIPDVLKSYMGQQTHIKPAAGK
jgi:seryl-tRNA synthetase